MLPELQRLGLLTLVDRAALAAYCATYSRWVEAEKQIAKTGDLVRTPSGYVIQSPYIGIANRSLKLMLAYATEFGMTPSSRSRVQTGEEADNPLDSFLDERIG